MNIGMLSITNGLIIVTNMDINKKYKTFISFLKEKGCYESFKDYYYNKEKEIPNYHDNLSLKQYINEEMDDVIMFSFDWDESLEGYDYWDKIDDDWRELVEKYGW